MTAHDIETRIRGLTRLVGNTPLLAIDLTFRGRPRVLYAKAENLNMTGSIKDRMALHIVRRAYASQALRPGDTIVEATSGNTGISFAGIGRALGHPVAVFMPDWMSRERINLIKSMGAEVRLVSAEEGGFLGSIRLAEEYAASSTRAFLPRQFSNEDNIVAHAETTAPELWWQLRYHGMKPDAFVAGVGTGGTVMGVARYLSHVWPAAKVHPLEPANSPTLSTGCRVGEHRIQGISDEFIPPIVHLDALDEVVSIDDGDAIIMAQKLACRLGIAVGISSGANFLGALTVQDVMGGDAVVATVFPDDNKKYLSTDLMKEEPVKDGFLSPEVELLGFRGFKRVCHTCCEPLDCAQVTRLEQEQPEPLPPCPLGYGAADVAAGAGPRPARHWGAWWKAGGGRPATGDRRPATGDRRPATGDWRLGTGDWGPAAGDWRLATGDRRPATDSTTHWLTTVASPTEPSPLTVHREV